MDTNTLAAILSGAQSNAAAMPAPQASTNPLERLSSILSGNGLGDYMQKVGMGMANMREGNDPYVAFANGMGGTAKATTDEEAAQAKAQQDLINNQIAANKLQMDQSQFDTRMSQDQSQFDARTAQDQNQFDEQQAIRLAAEKRQQLIADQAQKKTTLEIKKLAQNNGITIDQQLSIMKTASEMTKDVIDPAERKQQFNAIQDELVRKFTTGTAPGEGPGLKTNVDGTTGAPVAGAVVNGFRFKGGDPHDQNSWEAE